MVRRAITILVTAMMAVAMMGATASAHVHDKAGFIGPDPTGPGGGAHNGIQCAALSNPNIDAEGFVGVFFCPSPER